MSELEGKANKTSRSYGSISDFITNHGIAIFLVIFFVIEIYPEQQREREAWIHEITLLREALNPSNRSLTEDQALSILELVAENYTRALEDLFFNKIDDDHYIAGDLYDREWFEKDHDGDPNSKSVNINSQIFNFDFSEDKKEAEIQHLYSTFVREAVFYKSQAEKFIGPSYSESKRMANYSSQILKSFSYRGENLYQIWTDAVLQIHHDYDERLVSSIIKIVIENDRTQLFDDVRSLKYTIPEDWYNERSEIDFIALQDSLGNDLRLTMKQRLNLLSQGDEGVNIVLRYIKNHVPTDE